MASIRRALSAAGQWGRRSWSTHRVIPAAPEVVWELLTCPARWPEWGPTVRSATGPPVIAAGARGSVTPIVGPPLRYRITEFEPGRSWSWTVAGVRATDHRIKPRRRADGRLMAELTLTAPWWAPIYLPVLWLAARRIESLAVGAPSGNPGVDGKDLL